MFQLYILKLYYNRKVIKVYDSLTDFLCFTFEKISILQIYSFKLYNYKSKFQDCLYLYKNFKKFILQRWCLNPISYNYLTFYFKIYFK